MFLSRPGQSMKKKKKKRSGDMIYGPSVFSIILNIKRRNAFASNA